MIDHKKLHAEALERSVIAWCKATDLEYGLNKPIVRDAMRQALEAYLSHVRASIDDAKNVQEMAMAIGKATCVRDDSCCRNDQAQAASSVDMYRAIICNEGK